VNLPGVDNRLLFGVCTTFHVQQVPLEARHEILADSLVDLDV